MSINEYKNDFLNCEMQVSTRMFAGLILVVIFLLVINNNFYLYDYYKNKIVVEDNLSMITSLDELDLVVSNNKLIYRGKVSAYKVKEVKKDNIISNGKYYREVILECSKCSSTVGNVFDVMIVKDKRSIFDLIKNIFGG